MTQLEFITVRIGQCDVCNIHEELDANGQCDVCNIHEELDANGQCDDCHRPEFYNEGLRTSVTLNYCPSNPPQETILLRYGMTLRDWYDLFALQGEACAICNSPTAFAAEWHTDHCHDAERSLGIMVVRGILCSHCNTRLAHNRDWTESPQMVDYLLQKPRVYGDRSHLTDADIRKWQPMYWLAKSLKTPDNAS